MFQAKNRSLNIAAVFILIFSQIGTGNPVALAIPDEAGTVLRGTLQPEAPASLASGQLVSARKTSAPAAQTSTDFLQAGLTLTRSEIKSPNRSDRLDRTAVAPFYISTSLRPEADREGETVRNLSVRVDMRGNATVVWTDPEGNRHSYSGKIDNRTSQIVITPAPAGSESPVKFVLSFNKVQKGQVISYTFKTLQVDWPLQNTQTLDRELYTFGTDGLLTKYEFHSTSSFGSAEYVRSYSYRFVPGRKVLESVIFASNVLDLPQNQRRLGGYEIYYQNDARGNLLGRLEVSKVFDQGIASYEGEYWLADSSRNTRTSAFVKSVSSDLLKLVNSWKNYSAIDQWAATRRIEYQRNASGTYNYYVDEQKVNGVFVPKMTVHLTHGTIDKIWIVQGKPDIFSREHNDIFILPSQDVNGWHIFYGSTNNHYALIFTKSDANGQSTRVTLDYPAQNIITLDGKKYDVTINTLGVVVLTPYVPVVVAQYQIAIGTGTSVKLYENGNYEFTYDGKTYQSNAQGRVLLADGTELEMAFTASKPSSLTLYKESKISDRVILGEAGNLWNISKIEYFNTAGEVISDAVLNHADKLIRVTTAQSIYEYIFQRNIDLNQYYQIVSGQVIGSAPQVFNKPHPETQMFAYAYYSQGSLSRLSIFDTQGEFSLLKKGTLDFQTTDLTGLPARTLTAVRALVKDDSLVRIDAGINQNLVASDGVNFIFLNAHVDSLTFKVNPPAGRILDTQTQTDGRILLTLPQADGTNKVYDVTIDDQGIVRLTRRVTVAILNQYVSENGGEIILSVAGYYSGLQIKAEYKKEGTDQWVPADQAYFGSAPSDPGRAIFYNLSADTRYEYRISISDQNAQEVVSITDAFRTPEKLLRVSANSIQTAVMRSAGDGSLSLGGISFTNTTTGSVYFEIVPTGNWTRITPDGVTTSYGGSSPIIASLSSGALGSRDSSSVSFSVPGQTAAGIYRAAFLIQTGQGGSYTSFQVINIEVEVNNPGQDVSEELSLLQTTQTMINGIEIAKGQVDVLLAQLPDSLNTQTQAVAAESILISAVTALETQLQGILSQGNLHFSKEAIVSLKNQLDAKVGELTAKVDQIRNQENYLVYVGNVYTGMGGTTTMTKVDRANMPALLQALSEAMVTSGSTSGVGTPEAYASLLGGVDPQDVTGLLSTAQRRDVETIDPSLFQQLNGEPVTVREDPADSNFLSSVDLKKLLVRLIEKYEHQYNTFADYSTNGVWILNVSLTSFENLLTRVR